MVGNDRENDEGVSGNQDNDTENANDAADIAIKLWITESNIWTSIIRFNGKNPIMQRLKQMRMEPFQQHLMTMKKMCTRKEKKPLTKSMGL